MQNRLSITSNKFSADLVFLGSFASFTFAFVSHFKPPNKKDGKKQTLVGKNPHWYTNTTKTSTFELIKFLSYSCTFVPTPWCITFLCLSNYVLKILGISTGDWKHPIQSDIHHPFNEPNWRESSNATRNHSLQGTNHLSPPSRWIFGSLGPVQLGICDMLPYGG